MKSCSSIVPHFLKLASRGARGGMTPLKLQKLLYYAQAWYLVFKNEPLFGDKIEAWVHGPVIPSIYREYKQYGYSEITAHNFVSINSLNKDEQSIILLVWNTYGNLRAKFLEQLTHSEYPWIHARQGIAKNQSSSRVISLADMKQYYSQFVVSSCPPKIHLSALEISLQKLRSTKLQNILYGMGSVLNIYPSFRKYHTYYSLDDFSNELSDFESLQSDWENIGSDFLSTMDLIVDAKNRKT